MGEEAGCLTESSDFLKNTKIQHYVAKDKKKSRIRTNSGLLVTRRRFELRTPCLKGRCSAD